MNKSAALQVPCQTTPTVLCAGLARVQHHMTRMLPGYKDIPYEGRIIKLRLLTLQQRQLRGDLIEVFKIMN